MKDKALYFPYINIPPTNWFLQTLLYWDEVGAIVPRDFIHEPERLDPEMREMVREGLVRQIIPDLYTLQAGNRFSETFINLIEKYGLNRKAKESKFGPIYSSKIHIDKFGYEIREYLVREKLAIRESEKWYRVEPTTAGLFMSYLALFLGNDDSLLMQPMTDDYSSMATFSEEYALGKMNQFELLDKMRIDVVSNILPVPTNIWDIREIREAKDEFGELLPPFRRKVEDEIKRLSFLDDKEELKFNIEKFKRDSKEEINEIIGRMSDKKWGNIIFGTVCGLGAAAIPGVRAIATNDWVSGLEAIPGLLGAVYSAYDGFKSKQDDLIESPLAYAAFIKREMMNQ